MSAVRGDTFEATIPEVAIRRLPLYARALAGFAAEGLAVVSSNELGERLQITPAQIRKDLSYFGEFGKQGTGYDVCYLLGQIRRILGLNRSWSMALVGVGQLGRAVLGYGGFGAEGFDIIAAFDANPSLVGCQAGDLVVQDVGQFADVVQTRDIVIGIIAVPAAQAQRVADLMVQAGIRAILNYAPTALTVPAGVRVQHIDPVVALESMTYFLVNGRGAEWLGDEAE